MFYSYLKFFYFCASFFWFADVQDKAMIGMKINPRVFIKKTKGVKTSENAQEFNFFKDNLPYPETLSQNFFQAIVANEQCRNFYSMEHFWKRS